jgi:hypothetical protein
MRILPAVAISLNLALLAAIAYLFATHPLPSKDERWFVVLSVTAPIFSLLTIRQPRPENGREGLFSLWRQAKEVELRRRIRDAN